MWLVFLPQILEAVPIPSSDRWDAGRKPLWAKVSQLILSGFTTQPHFPPSSRPVSFSPKPLVLPVQVSSSTALVKQSF